MSDQKLNLKFIHLANTAAASEGSYDKGAIIFEPKSGRIAVKGNSGLEYYGGGRIADAKFENSILTISFNDGTTPAITLDFSDVASSSGVNKILGKLRTDVDALKEAVNGKGTESGHQAGLVDKVATNTSNIATNKDAIDLINHETNGILAKAKGYTDTKLSDLRGGESGYGGTLKDLDGRITSNTTNITNLQTLHASDGANGKKTVKQEIIDKVGSEITGTVKDYVDGKVSDINSTAATLEGRVDTLETTVNNAETGLVKKVADNAKAIADNAKAIADNAKNIASINNESTGILAQAKAYTDGKDTAVRGYIDGKVSAINETTGNLRKDLGQKTDAASADTAFGRIKSLEDKVNDENTGLVKKVGTLIGKDAGKSVRTIANEELAAQLIPEGAKESLNTLQEIAAWIQNHPDDASAMNTAIDALKKAVGEPAKGEVAATGLYKDIADNKSAINVNAGAIDALEALHAPGKNVAAEVSEGIAGIIEHSETNDKVNPKTADVVVTVTTKAGSVSGVAVDASILRNDLGQKTAAASADTAFGRIKALETTVGDKDSGLVKGVADNKSAIKALQDAQASGSLMWSSWAD